MLTDIQCRSAQPGDRDYKLADAQGLYLFVKTSGFKSWRLKYRFGGKEKLLTFGPYPTLKLSEARKQRDDAKRMLLDGVDPYSGRRGAGSAGHNPSLSFETLAREWLALQGSTWSNKHAQDVQDSLPPADSDVHADTS